MYRLAFPRLRPDGTADSAHDVTPLPAWRPASPQAPDASRGSDGTFCLHERHRTSREHNTMAVQLAQHLATALGQLLGLQLRGAQPRRPIGCQCTVCRTRDAQFLAVCRRSKMVATGTRRPRRGARLCRRWVCNGDKMVSFSTSIDALQSGWNVKNLRDLINLVSAFPGLDHGVGQPLASGLPHACPHVLLGDRGP